MKRLFLLPFTQIFMHLPVFSYASFPIACDTNQIQKETLEEYQIRIKKQGVLTKKNREIYEDSKIIKKWKSKSIVQKVILIMLLLFLLFVALTYVAMSSLDLSYLFER